MDKPNTQERRRLKRRNISYYLAVMDSHNQQIIGHVVDISPTGLMLDSKVPIPTDLSFNLRLDLMENIVGKAFVEFIARSKWCRPDLIQPYLYNVGFQITNIAPSDIEVLKLIAEKYGAG